MITEHYFVGVSQHNKLTTAIREILAVFSSTVVVIDVNITLAAASCILNMFKYYAENRIGSGKQRIIVLYYSKGMFDSLTFSIIFIFV